MTKFKSFVSSPAFLHGLLIAAHIAVAVFVKSPGSLALATSALSEADQLAK
jgi:hypothetical protein